MDIIISNMVDEPIYLQIENQIKAKIMSGELTAGEALPSMRNLAMQLRISVITTKRAYEELEREGLVYTVPAKGCFVAGLNQDMLRERHLQKIEEHLAEAARLADVCGLKEEEIVEMLHMMWEGEP